MEIDFLYLMKVVALSTVAFIIYRLMIEENKTKTKDHYTRPAWNFSLKKLYAEYILNKNKKRKLKFLKELRKYESEAPKLLPNEESTDSQKIYGTDQDGNGILMKYTRRRNGIAEIWLILRLKVDQKFVTYTLPDHPRTKIGNTHPKCFESSGLKIECLVPYARWRISYTGMMRKGITQDISDDESDFQFIKFNFIWTAASDPLFWPYEWNTGLIASALATEKWRDGKWKNLINLNDAGGYDQFGALKGELKIFENNLSAYVYGQLPKFENIELNLPGLRNRRWGPHKNETLHRTGVILGNMKDGTVIEVGAFSSKIGVTHSQFGNIRTCTGIVLPIKWTDFHLASIGEYQDQLPQATIVQIEAGNQSFIAVVTFKNHEKVPLFGGHVGEKWNAFVVPVDIVCNCIRGYGFAVFWYPRNIRQYDLEEVPIKIRRIFHRADMPAVNKQVVSFAEKEAQSILVAGGKGSSLAMLRVIQESKGEQVIDHRRRNFQVLNALVDQLSSNSLRTKLMPKHVIDAEPPKTGRQRAGSITKTIFTDPNDTPDFYVPQGFIVSVSAFDEHVKRNDKIRSAIEEMEGIAYEKLDGNLEEACRRIQSAFRSTSITTELKNLLIPKLDQINFDATARFAVRSSGTAEDTEELSAAGQNQTFLGLVTHEDVFEAIVKCWSSLYSHQSVIYRKQNILPVVSSMAVVVQKMVPADCAGVIFSRHFLNGDPNIIVITANYGLGESVVSAKSEPDTFLVKRSYKGDDVEVIGAICGDKKFSIEMDEKSVTEKVIDDEKREKLCLTDDVVLRLSKIAILLEKHYCTPRDIEFAVTKDKKIYLLQSRTITSLNNFTDWEIAHETDSAIMSPEDISTRANVGEVLNGALTKLSRALITDTFEKINAGLLMMPFSPLHNKLFHSFNDTIFMDVYHQFLSSTGNKISVMEKIQSFSVFGSDVFKQYPQIMTIASHRNAYRNAVKQKLKEILLFMNCVFRLDLTKMKESIEKMTVRLSEQNLLRYKTSSDVLDLILQEMEDWTNIAQGHLMASANSVLFNTLVFAVLTKGAKDLTIQHQRDVTLILSSIGNIESANVPKMIEEITESVKKSKKEVEFGKIPIENSLEWMRENTPEAYQLFQDFLQRHGHRALKEFDLSSKTWAMEPEKVIQMIKSNMGNSTNGPKVQPSEDEVISQLNTPTTNMSRKFLKFFMRKSHEAVQRREMAKSQLIKAVNELRRGVICLSGKMVNEGLLPDKELIYHLTVQEIKALIKNRNPMLINKAVRRSKMYIKHNELFFDEINFGVPKPTCEKVDEDEILEGDVIAKGMPVCSGKVTARACVIKNFTEIDKLQKGDILVTYCTDIAWSPYFNLLSGLCTEIGGLISHGAVVARECNLPCIVGASRATDKIKHGDQIYLNADEGVIARVSN